MSENSPLQEYASALGKLLGNLHTLEMFARMLLSELEGPKKTYHLECVRPGDLLPEDPLTDYDSLRGVIQRVNRCVEPTRPELAIDENLVELRDTVAHGRFFALEPKLPVRLIKFGKPRRDRRVPVEAVELVDVAWLDEKIRWVHGQIMKIVEARDWFDEQAASSGE